MSTPMKIPRTMNEQYKIIRAEDEEQRKRKTSVNRETSVKREATVSSVNPHILPISIPMGTPHILPLWDPRPLMPAPLS
jgi:hypothetical protein